MEEEQLIKNCQDSIRSSQEILYKKYATKLKGICLRYSRTEFEAEDIFQEAFVKVFHNIKKYDFKGSFEGWIKRIVLNTAIDHYKKNYSLLNILPIEQISEDNEASYSDILGYLSIEEILKIVQKLPEGYRLIFNMYAVDGYSHKEISEMLNISSGTSKSQLSKARKMIQKQIEISQFYTK